MRLFLAGGIALALFVASLLAMINDDWLSALTCFAGALVMGWRISQGRDWAQWGNADPAMDFVRNPAGALATDDDRHVADQPRFGDCEADQETAALPFDPDIALSRYMEKKAAGLVEPVGGQGFESRPSGRTRFGRKAG